MQTQYKSDMLDTIAKQGYYFIAEIGVNYYDIAIEKRISALDAAKLMCKEAKISGIDAVKFQTYKAETLASKNSPSYWDLAEEPTTSQYELFKQYDSFGKREYQEISRYCNELGITFLSTPFDFESVEYLNDLMPYYKISSSDITNIPFIKYIAKKGKPILLSTGASEKFEIDAALKAVKSVSDVPMVLMHCVLEYPTPYEHASLGQITHLLKQFSWPLIGYSDHTVPDKNYDVIKTAYILGAKVIEKHFTLNKKLKGNDHYHAMDVNDALQIKNCLNNITQIIGDAKIQCLKSEHIARTNARRSIVLRKSMNKGDIIKFEDIRLKRPGIGIPPSELEQAIGKKVNCNLDEDTILKWEMLE